jgi:hypothetical protein
MIENAGTPQARTTATFGGVEIRTYGQGTAEVITARPSPDVRLVNGVPS